MKIKITRKEIEIAGTISFPAGAPSDNHQTPVARR
jgi:hypothetical protein